MHITIKHHTAKARRGVQTYYADLPVEEVEDLERAIADPSRTNDLVRVACRAEGGGSLSVKEWPAGQIEVRRTPGSMTT